MLLSVILASYGHILRINEPRAETGKDRLRAQAQWRSASARGLKDKNDPCARKEAHCAAAQGCSS